jgi:hypothetical protein
MYISFIYMHVYTHIYAYCRNISFGLLNFPGDARIMLEMTDMLFYRENSTQQQQSSGKSAPADALSHAQATHQTASAPSYGTPSSAQARAHTHGSAQQMHDLAAPTHSFGAYSGGSGAYSGVSGVLSGGSGANVSTAGAGGHVQHEPVHSSMPTHDGGEAYNESSHGSSSHKMDHNVHENSPAPGQEEQEKEQDDEEEEMRAILHSPEATRRLHEDLAEVDGGNGALNSVGVEQRSELAKRIYRIRAYCRFAHAGLVCAAARPLAWPSVLAESLEALHGRLQEYLDVAVHERFLSDKVNNTRGSDDGQNNSQNLQAEADPYSATLNALRDVESLQEFASAERSARSEYAQALQSFLDGSESDLDKAGVHLSAWESRRSKLEDAMREVIDAVAKLFARGQA